MHSNGGQKAELPLHRATKQLHLPDKKELLANQGVPLGAWYCGWLIYFREWGKGLLHVPAGHLKTTNKRLVLKDNSFRITTN